MGELRGYSQYLWLGGGWWWEGVLVFFYLFLSTIQFRAVNIPELREDKSRFARNKTFKQTACAGPTILWRHILQRSLLIYLNNHSRTLRMHILQFVDSFLQYQSMDLVITGLNAPSLGQNPQISSISLARQNSVNRLLSTSGARHRVVYQFQIACGSKTFPSIWPETFPGKSYDIMVLMLNHQNLLNFKYERAEFYYNIWLLNNKTLRGDGNQAPPIQPGQSSNRNGGRSQCQ